MQHISLRYLKKDGDSKMSVINWIDETSSGRGTPVNRLRLMGMQGFFPQTTSVVQTSSTVTTITAESAEGTLTTTITEGSNSTTIVRQFVPSDSSGTITQNITISESGTTTTITETTTN